MDRIIEPLAIIVICLGALWIVGVAYWLGKMAALAVLLTCLLLGFVWAVVELVLALVDRAAGRGEGL